MSFKSKLKNKNKNQLQTRIIIYSLLSLVSLLIICLFPKNIIKEDKLYTKLLNMSLYESENDLAYKSNKVYLDLERFNDNLNNDIKEEVKKFKETSSLMVVEIKGEGEPIYYKDYIMAFDSSLNLGVIKFFAVRNIKLGNNLIPTETAVSAAMNGSKKFNEIIYPVTLSLSSVLLLTFGIFDILNILELTKRKKEI